MIYGYLRVSTDKQCVANQKKEILDFSQRKNIDIDKWVNETVSGKVSRNYRKLGLLLKRMKKGDMIIVTEISRLSRTLVEVMEIMSFCLKKGIKLYSVKEGYEFDDSINSQVLCFAFGLAADIERRMISMRTKEALAARKAAGVVLGRRPGTCPKMAECHDNKDLILSLLSKGYTKAQISKMLGVGQTTLYRFLSDNLKSDKGLTTKRTFF